MEDIIKKSGGRKFLFAGVGLFLSFVLVLLDKMGAESWAAFTSVLFGFFAAANVANKKVTSKPEA